MNAHLNFVNDRKATVWGPWRSRRIVLKKAISRAGIETRITGEEFGLFPVDAHNFVEMSVMYAWWSLSEKSGMKIHCLYDHMNEQYTTAGVSRFMNRRLWYTVCYKFVRSFDFMEKIIDERYDMCNICKDGVPWAVVMDGLVLSCNKQKLTQQLIDHERQHGDEAACDECVEVADDGDDEEEDAGTHVLDHQLKLSINARNLQQHLRDEESQPLHYTTRNPFTTTMRDAMKAQAEYCKSFAKKTKSVNISEARLNTM